LRTWNDLLADYPGIRVLVGDSWLGLRVGEPYADGYTENIDKFVLGTAAHSTMWDFDPASAPTTAKVTIVKYVDNVPATEGNTNNASFPMHAVFPGGEGDYALSSTGFNNPNPYQATTADMPVGSNYSTFENLPTSCTGTNAYALAGYSAGETKDEAFTNASSTDPAKASFTNLQSDKFVIVWNKTCPPAATYKVHILKYLDGATSTAITAGNYQFPMTATWSASNIGAGTGSYVLGTNFGGASDLYGADTAAMSGPYDYTTSEVTGGTSQVVASAAQCAPGKYYLQGYSVSYTGFAGAASASVSATPIALSQNNSDAYIIVWNKKCVATGEIRGSKFEDWDGDSKPFETKWEDGLSGWTIYLDMNNNGILDDGDISTTTKSGGGYRFTGLTAGTYHVREVQKSGWVSTYPSTTASSDKYDIHLAVGQIVKKKDFGNFMLGSISGMKFEDKNGNKKKDANETGLPGWTIILKGPGDTSISTTTDAQGKYSFTGLKAGIYKLSEVKQTGWIQTVSPKNVRITSGKDSVNNNFGNRQKPNNDNGQHNNDHHDNDED
jgi:uncharacterized protein (DUF2141 family)